MSLKNVLTLRPNGADYLLIIVNFLSDIFASHYDGTHSLHMIHWWASGVMLKLIYILDSLSVTVHTRGGYRNTQMRSKLK